MAVVATRPHYFTNFSKLQYIVKSAVQEAITTVNGNLFSTWHCNQWLKLKVMTMVDIWYILSGKQSENWLVYAFRFRRILRNTSAMLICYKMYATVTTSLWFVRAQFQKFFRYCEKFSRCSYVWCTQEHINKQKNHQMSNLISDPNASSNHKNVSITHHNNAQLNTIVKLPKKNK